MKRTVLYLSCSIVLILSGALVSCNDPSLVPPGSQATAKEVSNLPHGPEDFHEEFVKAYNAENIDALLDLYEVGAAVQPDPDTLFMVDAQKANLRGLYEFFMGLDADIDLPVTHMLCNGSVALVHSTWKLTSRADGAVIVTGYSSEVVREQPDGTWLVVIDIYDDDYSNTGGISIPADIVAFDAQFDDLYNARDLEGLLNLYERRDGRPHQLHAAVQEGSYPGYDTIIEDLEDLSDLYTLYLAGGDITELVLKKAVFNANVDIALLHSEWSVPSDGIGPCIATEVISRQPDGSWRYVNDIFDDPRP